MLKKLVIILVLLFFFSCNLLKVKNNTLIDAQEVCQVDITGFTYLYPKGKKNISNQITIRFWMDSSGKYYAPR
jgi:hypothetical protein